MTDLSDKDAPSERAQNLINELRRGTLVLAVLSQLDEPQYGYSLRQRLAEGGLDVEQGTLYPLLRRLEKHGLLDSEWSIETSDHSPSSRACWAESTHRSKWTRGSTPRRSPVMSAAWSRFWRRTQPLE